MPKSATAGPFAVQTTSKESVIERLTGAGAVGGLVVLTAAVLALAAATQPWVDPRLLFMDPVAAAERAGPDCCKAYYGLMSNLGVGAWTVAAAVSLFGAACALAAGRTTSVLAGLVFGGLLSALMALDDVLMLHEAVLPRFGVAQTAVLAGYAMLVAAYAFIQRGTLRTTLGAFLVVALAGFGASVGLDVFFEAEVSVRVAEDVAKFVGVASWGSFHCILAYRVVTGLDLRGQGGRP